MLILTFFFLKNVCLLSMAWHLIFHRFSLSERKQKNIQNMQMPEDRVRNGMFINYILSSKLKFTTIQMLSYFTVICGFA